MPERGFSVKPALPGRQETAILSEGNVPTGMVTGKNRKISNKKF